jgi:hypothetical protein
VTFRLGEYEGRTDCGCSASDPITKNATTLNIRDGSLSNPSTGFGFQQTKFLPVLTQGWQSGSFTMFLEGGAATQNYNVAGTITGSRVVPEPSTLLSLALGIGVVALRRRPSDKERQH